ncbi:MAG: hypothetical protein ACFFG0_09650 [Candidatus Thorarchaeota archaeon]
MITNKTKLEIIKDDLKFIIKCWITLGLWIIIDIPLTQIPSTNPFPYPKTFDPIRLTLWNLFEIPFLLISLYQDTRTFLTFDIVLLIILILLSFLSFVTLLSYHKEKSKESIQ